jgi:UDPglucose 6-dehydrogenase/GDP-mannose 6-dehydrogenase
MKISIVGTGYVGLVSGVCLSELGHEVICVDSDVDKVKKLNSCTSPIYETGLDDLLIKHVDKRLHATTNLSQAIANTELTIIAVGTPFDGNVIDLTYIKNVSEDIGKCLKEKKDYHVVVVKSTVVPGTTDEIVLPLLEKHSGKRAGIDFGLGMNPEFLREGEAIQDFMSPDRIVIGGIDKRSQDSLCKVYAQFKNIDKVVTNNKTAEMIKYTSNALLATMISFSNEIGNLCSTLGDIDALEVMKGVHLDKRISPILESGERIQPGITSYLEAGCGFGGSCFPKDVKALIAHGISVGENMSLLKSVININQQQPEQIINRLLKHFPDLTNIKIAIMGLAFKPGTNDMRESPAIPIVNALLSSKARISAYDPIAEDEAKKIFKSDRITYYDSIETALEGVDAILLLTRWPELEAVPEILKSMGTRPLLVDGRRMLAKDSVARYEGIGV